MTARYEQTGGSGNETNNLEKPPSLSRSRFEAMLTHLRQIIADLPKPEGRAALQNSNFASFENALTIQRSDSPYSKSQ